MMVYIVCYVTKKMKVFFSCGSNDPWYENLLHCLRYIFRMMTHYFLNDDFKPLYFSCCCTAYFFLSDMVSYWFHTYQVFLQDD